MNKTHANKAVVLLTRQIKSHQATINPPQIGIYQMVFLKAFNMKKQEESGNRLPQKRCLLRQIGLMAVRFSE
ncbi:hypothetical protein BZJ18_11060 [Salinivibrio sp. IB872]|nr:hypothetical protein BZJ18_11060 [Salinivibrio sp. IB872]